MTHEGIEKIKHDVLAASQRWIANFNAGDVDSCVAAYTSHAIMHATPMGTFTGSQEIAGFWRPFMNSGATGLVYRNIDLQVVDDSTVLLSADWSMNVGRGIITMEKWVKQEDGQWRLEQDDFEVQEQFGIPNE